MVLAFQQRYKKLYPQNYKLRKLIDEKKTLIPIL